MVTKIKERFLIWLVGWAILIDGIVGVLSIGLLRPTLALTATKYLARWRYKNMYSKE